MTNLKDNTHTSRNTVEIEIGGVDKNIPNISLRATMLTSIAYKKDEMQFFKVTYDLFLNSFDHHMNITMTLSVIFVKILVVFIFKHGNQNY